MTKSYVPQRESPKAKTGKSIYLALGEGRNFQAVADEMGVRLPTVRNWSAWFEWTDAAEAWDNEVQAKALASARGKAAEEHGRRLRSLPIEQLNKADELMTSANKLHSLVDRELTRIIEAETKLSIKDVVAAQRSEREAIALAFKLKYEALGIEKLINAFLDRQGVR